MAAPPWPQDGRAGAKLTRSTRACRALQWPPSRRRVQRSLLRAASAAARAVAAQRQRHPPQAASHSCSHPPSLPLLFNHPATPAHPPPICRNAVDRRVPSERLQPQLRHYGVSRVRIGSGSGIHNRPHPTLAATTPPTLLLFNRLAPAAHCHPPTTCHHVVERSAVSCRLQAQPPRQ